MVKEDRHKITGRLHSMESMGLVDGPGIRTIFFLQGCPLRCAYCHNPDSQSMEGGRTISPTEILQVAKRYKPYQGDDGGITFSGGEPLMQGAFLAQTLPLLKENGFNICIDTSGFGQKDYYPQIFPYVDTLILDIKAFSEEGYKDMCAVSQKPVLDLMNHLEDYGFVGQIWIRHVMVPGYTDNKASMEALVQTIHPILHLVERLEILPYHTMGIDKYTVLGMTYGLEGVPAMDREKAKNFEIYTNQVLAQELQNLRASSRQAGPKIIPFQIKFPSGETPVQNDLAVLPLIKDLPKEILEGIRSRLVIRDLQAGDMLFQSGDAPDQMFIIQSGTFKIFDTLPNMKEQILYIYRPNDFVGGHNLLAQTPYWYTAQAMTPAQIVAIPEDIFRQHFENEPAVLKAILNQSFERIRWAEDLITRLATFNNSVKTASLILRLAESFGQEADGLVQIPMEFDRAEMTSYAGLSRDALTRKLGEFEALGYIEIENDILTILNPEALAAYLD